MSKAKRRRPARSSSSRRSWEAPLLFSPRGTPDAARAGAAAGDRTAGAGRRYAGRLQHSRAAAGAGADAVRPPVRPAGRRRCRCRRRQVDARRSRHDERRRARCSSFWPAPASSTASPRRTRSRRARSAPGLPARCSSIPCRCRANVVPPQAEIGNLPPPFAGGQVATGQRVGILGDRDYMNTPFSTTSYTQKYIQDNQALTLMDAVADDPTIRAIYGQGSYSDAFMIRGFYLGLPDMSFNGLYGVNPQNSVNLLGIETGRDLPRARAPCSPAWRRRARSAARSTSCRSGRPTRRSRRRRRAIPRRASSAASSISAAASARTMRSACASMPAIPAARHRSTVSRNSLLGVTVGLDYRSESTRIDADFGYQNRNIIGAQGGTAVAAGLTVPAAPKRHAQSLSAVELLRDERRLWRRALRTRRPAQPDGLC